MQAKNRETGMNIAVRGFNNAGVIAGSGGRG